jgi:peptidyl-prolyl cis-trans isomerase D
LVRAAFTADKGKVLINNEGSTIFEFGNKFVIGALTTATEAGLSTFEEAKIRVDLAVRKDKKAQKLTEKFKNAASGQTDLASVASKLSTDVKVASGINFNSFSIPAIGFEPAVIGTVCNLAEGKISEPIEGNNGVFLAKVTSITTGTDTNQVAEKTRLAQELNNRATGQIFETLKKVAEIDDRRSKFY